MQTITVAEACENLLAPVFLYTSHRGGLVLSIRDDGDDWYTIEVDLPKKEKLSQGLNTNVTRQVRGSKRLFVVDKLKEKR